LLDIRQIQRLSVESVWNSCLHDYNKKQVIAWTSKMKNITRWKCVLLGQFCIVATRSNHIVGFGSLDRGKYIDFLYVHYLFQRQGVASLIYKMLKKRSLQLGSKKISTHASKTAKSFFISKQFKTEKIHRIVFSGVAISNYAMREK